MYVKYNRKQKLFSIMSNLQSHYNSKLDLKSGYTIDKWIIHGTKHHKDIQLQSLELPCRIS